MNTSTRVVMWRHSWRWWDWSVDHRSYTEMWVRLMIWKEKLMGGERGLVPSRSWSRASCLFSSCRLSLYRHHGPTPLNWHGFLVEAFSLFMFLRFEEKYHVGSFFSWQCREHPSDQRQNSSILRLLSEGNTTPHWGAVIKLRNLHLRTRNVWKTYVDPDRMIVDRQHHVCKGFDANIHPSSSFWAL